MSGNFQRVFSGMLGSFRRFSESSEASQGRSCALQRVQGGSGEISGNFEGFQGVLEVRQGRFRGFRRGSGAFLAVSQEF